MRARAAAGCLAMALLLGTTSLSALQSRPDFTGEWTKLVSTPTGTVTMAEMSVFVGVPQLSMLETMTIELGEEVLTITAPIMGEVRSFSHPLDGSEQSWRLTREGRPVAPGEPAEREGITSAAAWEGERIVIRMTSNDAQVRLEQVLALDASGRLQVTTSGSALHFTSEPETGCFARSDSIDPASWAPRFREGAAAACR